MAALSVYKVTTKDGHVVFALGRSIVSALSSAELDIEDVAEYKTSSMVERDAFMEGMKAMAYYLKKKHDEGHTITGDSLDLIESYLLEDVK